MRHIFTNTETELGNRPVRAVRLFGELTVVAVLLNGCAPDDRKPQPTPTAITAAPNISPHPGPRVLLLNSHHSEVEQFGADTFADYTHASGVGPRLPKGVNIDVDCLVIGPEDAAPSSHGEWYHIEAPDKWAGYFAAANTFENGDTSGALSNQPETDLSVPDCP